MRTVRHGRGLRLALGILGPLMLAGAAGAQSVVINEVQTGNPDWIEIINLEPAPIDVGGWAVHSSHGFTIYPSIPLPAGTVIQPGSTLIVLEGYANLPPYGVPVVAASFTWGWVGSSTGAVLLVDAGGVGQDLVVFGENGVAIPGGGMGATFEGRVGRGSGLADSIFRTVLADGDSAVEFVSGGSELASPGTINPNQASYATVVRDLILESGGAAYDADAGLFQLTATIVGVHTADGTEIRAAAWDPLIGGSITITGLGPAPSPALDGMLMSPCAISLVSGVDPTDQLLLVASLTAASELELVFGGPASATPERRRRLVSLTPMNSNRTGFGSGALDGLLARVASGEDLVPIVHVSPGAMRLAGATFEPDTGGAFASAIGSHDQGLEIGVIGAAPGAQIWNVIDVAPPHPLGTGPVAGIRLGELQMQILSEPLGNEPWHVAASPDGTYHFATPAGILPVGLVLDLVTAQQPWGQAVQILTPRRVVVF